ncbi:hypothetical protein BLS_005062 [Venturia inaequalis]|uniref:Uncharacterized protein n=1 Tax=Venturia inaequalis TaxID=5025 RepID=A0A8H3YR38_VENIN|nr:hypothetical protein BLS_005062 [Venturia inaequalis]KAE9990948.1 hypothetical protein EG327_000719 [Venturia inaequalis]RDI81701.1 hypothetical protein Vi05172_g8442 [Venturia inaequalis]
MVFYITLSLQAQNNLGDYLSLLTLCLAPLFVHLSAGVPSPTILSFGKEPSWYDRLCHFNPTSVCWRYFAIIDRRVRAKRWDAANFRASNALFWTGHSWDGSEGMIEKSQSFCIKQPSSTHVHAFSSSSVKTVIILLQAAQALYTLIGSMVLGNHNFAYITALDNLFFPLVCVGLMRIPAACWLDDDQAFRNAEASDNSIKKYPCAAQDESRIEMEQIEDLPTNALLPTYQSAFSDRFYHPHGWRGILVRSIYLAITIGLLATSLVTALLPGIGGQPFTATGLVTRLFYITFLAVTVVATLIYMVRYPATTVIPCIQSTWYKIYTSFLFACTMAMLILASMETRRTPCGKSTTLPARYDQLVCGNSTYVYAENRVNATDFSDFHPSDGLYGLAYRAEGYTRVISFDGWCKLNRPTDATPLKYYEIGEIFEPANITQQPS